MNFSPDRLTVVPAFAAVMKSSHASRRVIPLDTRRVLSIGIACTGLFTFAYLHLRERRWRDRVAAVPVAE